MRARLICKTRAGTDIDCPFEDRLTIGRGSQSGRSAGMLALDNDMISAKHASIEWDPGLESFVLEDHSANGTLLDGEPVHTRERLASIHVISLAGEYDFIFVTGPAAAAPPAVFVPPVQRASETVRQAPPPGFVPPVQRASETVRQAPPPELVPPVLRPSETVRQAPPPELVPPRPSIPTPTIARPFRMEIRVAGADVQTHELQPGSYRVGRLQDNDIVIAHPTVSKQHAVIIVEPQRVVVRNLSQNSRTFYRGEPIQEVQLSRGTRLFFGEAEALLS